MDHVSARSICANQKKTPTSRTKTGDGGIGAHILSEDGNGGSVGRGGVLANNSKKTSGILEGVKDTKDVGSERGMSGGEEGVSREGDVNGEVGMSGGGEMGAMVPATPLPLVSAGHFFDLPETPANAPSPGQFRIFVELLPYSGEYDDDDGSRTFSDDVDRMRHIMDQLEDRLLDGEDLEDILDVDEREIF